MDQYFTVLSHSSIFGILCHTKKENILIGLAHIITSPAILITDFILVGGIGAAFLNALLILF
ncbi:hypothetical protein HMPREF9466_01051 [Fusobacterium necrophorum subsp. funduliforme 1_1_36S]|nr:hypothetical protein HMPREF9466_01051 [Fusobacterium necrophorum subsp. funduliforme 1_1_36S]